MIDLDLRFQKPEDIRGYFTNEININHPIIRSLKTGELIVFVGAGMSKHLGIPDWKEFAYCFLDLVYNNNKLTLLNYKTKESLKNESVRKLLSICEFAAKESIAPSKREEAYIKWFKKELDDIKNKVLYEKLYKLNAIYLTTNYDNALDLLAKQPKMELATEEYMGSVQHEEERKVFFRLQDFNKDILKAGNVIHIHGSIEDTKNLIVTNEDYIVRYYSNWKNDTLSPDDKDMIARFKDFLDYVCDGKYVLLFIGYGLEEIEILQFLFDYIAERDFNSNRYLLFPCLADEFLKVSYLNDYYMKNYHINFLPLDITEKGYDSIEGFFDFISELSRKENHEPENIDRFNSALEKIMEW